MGDGRAANKTQPTDQPVEDFVAGVEPPRRQDEARRVVALLTEATGTAPVMWGTSIIGWGTYTYRYASGREGEWMKVGFSPRKAQLSFYGLQDTDSQRQVLDGLGPHTTGVGCVYVKRLEQVDEAVLSELARLGIARGDYDAAES
ncbi:DUF1801 domain-containing protein [Demequina zhanjiangensis]|uniref:DUF1801 domain-containing protein n=1 Tax=Demequina zhanjiangensis TaxID=3051659 RepID=A0ABT8G227_9MICO|nr:DUF1801 domain-containing protein [Demequina sp. SYSU T00b26]MDN4473190.1 DUF1801 domain-containing protein [Demequina sp. SYSU T00b26]